MLLTRFQAEASRALRKYFYPYEFRVMQSDLESLRKFIAAIHPLNDAEWTAFTEHWQPHIAKRKTILTAAGETERYVYFVLEGVQRAFYLGENEREATIVFTYPPSFSRSA